MKKTIETSHEVNAPAEKVWHNISKASGVNEWLPIIQTCELKGTGAGAKRVCGTENGVLNETILEIDQKDRRFKYSIDEQALFPIRDIVGTMTVREENDQTVLDWKLDFDLENEEMFPAIDEGVRGMYAAGVAGLEKISI